MLFFTSNGVGMGHLARAIAIARRLGPGFRPVIVTLSQAFGICRDFGIHAEYLPYHRYTGAAAPEWNAGLADELGLIADSHEASALVFDGVVPYGGLLTALRARPGLATAWCRIGMWRMRREAALLAHEDRFDLVIEPGELARPFDQGPTRIHRSRTLTVPPIRLLDDSEQMTRAEARADLGIAQDRTAVLVALGSGNNQDRQDLTRCCIDALLARGDVDVVEASWLMSDGRAARDPRVVPLERFPHARWINAFDAAVAAASYGLYHELAAASVPTLFIPNEHPENDDQLARARFAESRGLGLCLRAAEAALMGRMLDHLLAPPTLADLGRLRPLAGADGRNGAAAAAALVATLARCRANRTADDPRP
ncbi:hypothetical protein N825_34075 [Skermanella stibiiresistens SB22]|uniref:Glycosyl transferase family 28 C-terminal domain-containing protein n=1 Tax=Skermanella stibiiresistens SB22 TaxID=1385369 RepID=W9GTT4_9PROT|nr:hypothetical protein N825_34075 [Skermanella stibiiresistens SB22]